MNKWTADDARRFIENTGGTYHVNNLLAERDALVLHIQDFLNAYPGWADSKLFKALPEYLRKEIEGEVS